MRILITFAVAAGCVFGGWTHVLFAQVEVPPPLGIPADSPPPSDPLRPTLPPDANGGPSIFSPDAAVESGLDGATEEPLARGPLHEAFAEQVNLDSQPSPVVARQPPEPINELPPEIKPEGDNVEWISGYWAWDDEREDFIWVSGVWRRIPPGRRWLPGYWVAAESGHQWIAGTWANADAAQLSVLPRPPASLEHGANRPADSAGQIWIPGSWTYQDDQYYWRAGAWSAGYDDWTWIPERYIWTPGGCAYVDGYWDYPVTLRGYCYAPYSFGRPVYLRPGYALTPYVALNIGHVFAHIFVRPLRHHYYFGDYYGAAYVDRGFHPWHHYHRKHYEPLLAHYQSYHYRRGVDYVGHLSRWHDYHVRRPDVRPSHSFAHLNQTNDRLRNPGSRPQGLPHSQTLRGQATQPGLSQNQLGHHVRDLTARSLDASHVVRLPDQRRQEVARLSRQNQKSAIEHRRATSVRSGPGHAASSGLPISAAADRRSGVLAERPHNVSSGTVNSRTAQMRAHVWQQAASAESASGATARTNPPGSGGPSRGTVDRPETRDGRMRLVTPPSTIVDRLKSNAPDRTVARAVNPSGTRPRSPATSASVDAVPGLSAESTAPRPADRAVRPASPIQDRIRQAQQSAAATRSRANAAAMRNLTIERTRLNTRGTTSFHRTPSSEISRQPAPRAVPQSLSNQLQQWNGDARQRLPNARSIAIEIAPTPVVRAAPRTSRTPAPRVQTTVRPASPPPNTSTQEAHVRRRVPPSPAPRASADRPAPARHATPSGGSSRGGPRRGR